MRIHVGFLFCVVVLYSQQSFAVEFEDNSAYMNDEMISHHLSAQDMLLNDCFGEVDSIYASFIKDNPSDPAGYLFRAAGLIAEMLDREEDLHGRWAGELLDSAVHYSRLRLKQDSCKSTRAWMHLWIGHAKVYRSLYMSQFGSVVKAIRQGMAAKGDYHRSLEEDSTLYDAYFGLGSYHYWKSAKAGLLSWLGIFKNEKDKGIRELYLAVDSSLISKSSALSGLIYVWLDKKEFDSTIVYATLMHEKYSGGKSYLWPLASAYYQKQEYSKAMEIYLRLRERLNDQSSNYYNLIEVDYELCRIMEKLSRKDELPGTARRFEEYCKYISSDVRERQAGKINYLLRVSESVESGVKADSE